MPFTLDPDRSLNNWHNESCGDCIEYVIVISLATRSVDDFLPDV
jgi:hypothetical protein